MAPAVGQDGNLVSQPDQQAAIARMRAMRAAGASLRKIATEMAGAGRPLSHEGVKKIISAAPVALAA